MFFGTLTIANNGFSMVFGSPNHWFQWFLMVKDHWSNDGMVSMDRTGLVVAFVRAIDVQQSVQCDLQCCIACLILV